ncbi:MAG: winged helix DNA-binding domain-containing protein [Sandaracinaceae bacterium]
MKPVLKASAVRYQRAVRAHLAGPGASGPAEVARAVVGIQAQQEKPARHGVALRMARPPESSEVQEALQETRQVVRVWGQRDTLHVYDPADWRLVIGALPTWPKSGRKGAMPTEKDCEPVLAALVAAGRPLRQAELFDALPARFVREAAAHPAGAKKPERFAANRAVWSLARRGALSIHGKEGSENLYVARTVAFPSLPFDVPEPDEAAAALARRYLHTYGPATPADIAHFFGARVKDAKRWLARFEDALIEVECEGRKGLLLLASELDAYQTPAPKPDSADWPLRLLPLWDAQLMTHADKSWALVQPEESKAVWRKAAMLAPTVWSGGRIVGTWAQETKRGVLRVTVSPLSGWHKAHASKARPDANLLAAHLGLADVTLDVVR